MGLLDQLKALLRRETDDAKEWIDEAVDDANVSLDRAERRSSTDPNVRLQATLDDIAESEDSFAAVRDKAEARSSRPLAEAEVDEASSPAEAPREDDGS